MFPSPSPVTSFFSAKLSMTVLIGHPLIFWNLLSFHCSVICFYSCIFTLCCLYYRLIGSFLSWSQLHTVISIWRRKAYFGLGHRYYSPWSTDLVAADFWWINMSGKKYNSAKYLTSWHKMLESKGIGIILAENSSVNSITSKASHLPVEMWEEDWGSNTQAFQLF